VVNAGLKIPQLLSWNSSGIHYETAILIRLKETFPLINNGLVH